MAKGGKGNNSMRPNRSCPGSFKLHDRNTPKQGPRTKTAKRTRPIG